MPGLFINNPEKGTHFHKQSMDNPSSSILLQIVTISMWNASLIILHPPTLSHVFPLIRSSIVTSPLIRLVNLQSLGYFCCRHEFLGFLGCGERSSVQCSQHSHSWASLWRKYLVRIVKSGQSFVIWTMHFHR